MDLMNQIEMLKGEMNEAQATVTRFADILASERADMGRLKRTYNALVESDIAIEVHVTAQNGFEKDYSKLSDLMNDIITDKAEKADDLQGAVDDAKAKVKKLEKVIATLEDLTK